MNDPLDIWRHDLDPMPILGDPHVRLDSTLMALAEKLGAVWNLLTTLNDAAPEERQHGVEVANMAARYAFQVLSQFGLADGDTPPPQFINLQMARLAITNILARVRGELEEWILAAKDDDAPAQSNTAPRADSRTGGLVIDHNTFTVHYRGQSCKLGNSVAFRLMERLAASPGICIPHQTLAEEVWADDDTETAAIHKQASILGNKLKTAGLDALVIDGRITGHYRLILR